MTERELQLRFLMLEDSFRKLEDKVAKLEVDIELKRMLGVSEQLKNTSISLFLLRRDRERLSKDLGLDISEYTSVKSVGEEALEELIYNYKDVLLELSREVNEAKEVEPVFSPVILDIENDRADKVKKAEKAEKVEGIEKVEKKRAVKKAAKAEDKGVGIKLNMMSDVVEDLHTQKEGVGKTVQVQNQENKQESNNQEPVGVVHSQVTMQATVEQGAELKSHTTVATSSIEHLNDGTVATESFDDLDAALNMWT